MGKKRLKKLILLIIIVVCSGYGINTIFWDKFYAYSVFYAKEIPHDEEYYPELLFFLQRYDNMPAGIKTYYNRDFSDSSIDSTDDKYIASLQSDTIYFLNVNDSISYLLDYNGKILIYGDEYIDGEKMTSSDRQEFERSLTEFLKPVEEVTSKPLINLQWLFNQKYEGRFVDHSK